MGRNADKRKRRHAKQRIPGKKAVKHCRRLQAAVERVAAEERFDSGMRAMVQQRFADALEPLQSVPPSSPRYGSAQAHVALALRVGERFTEACAAADVALNVLSNSASDLGTRLLASRVRGECLLALGRPAEAHETYRVALSAAQDREAELNRLPVPLREVTYFQFAILLSAFAAACVELRRYDDADEVFQLARRALSNLATTKGKAEVLTDHAIVLAALGRRLDAELAWKEAAQIAEEAGDQEQLYRAVAGLQEIGSVAVENGKARQIMRSGAERATASGRQHSALVRWGRVALVALGDDDLVTAESALAEAEKLAHSSGDANLRPATLAVVRARISIARNDEAAAVKALIHGGRLWIKRLGLGLRDEDTSDGLLRMHNPLRMLTGLLLRNGRDLEALVSFETGRAIGHAAEGDRAILTDLSEANPFDSERSVVANIFGATIESLGNNVLLVPTVVPPDFIVFVVDATGVRAICEPLPKSEDAMRELYRDVDLVANRLEQGKGAASVPALVTTVAERAAQAVAGRNVGGILPYGNLHNIPWRSVLRGRGLAWSQLEGATEFGLVARLRPRGQPEVTEWTALGNGVAGRAPATIDLNGEARSFAEVMGDRATLIESASTGALRSALVDHRGVFLSCHGRSRPIRQGGGNAFVMADDDILVDRSLRPVHAPTILLSACDSAVYTMGPADYPLGAAPEFLRGGASFVVGSRFKLDANFSQKFFPALAKRLRDDPVITRAFAATCSELEGRCDDWRHLAALELLARP